MCGFLWTHSCWSKLHPPVARKRKDELVNTVIFIYSRHNPWMKTYSAKKIPSVLTSLLWIAPSDASPCNMYSFTSRSWISSFYYTCTVGQVLHSSSACPLCMSCTQKKKKAASNKIRFAENFLPCKAGRLDRWQKRFAQKQMQGH